MKSFLASLAFASTTFALPVQKLQKRDNIDPTILNYALTLEHLEATFYKQGLQNFTAADFSSAGFTDPNFYKNLQQLAADEATHVTFLTSALTAVGVTPVAQCNYNFGALTPKTFVQTSIVFEGIGVSAYLGAAGLVTNKTILTAAASILSDEARHDSFIRQTNTESPIPSAFDTPLDFNQVFSMAAPFISSCPSSNPMLPVKAFPVLTVQEQGNVTQGSTLTFHMGGSIPSGPLFIAWPLVTGPVFSAVTQDGDGCLFANVPSGASAPAGQSYAILTSSNTALTDTNTVAGPAVIEVTPPTPSSP